MSSFDDWRPVRRNTSRYLADLEAWVEEFVPWSVRTRPLLVPSPAEQAMQEAAQQIAERMLNRVARTNEQSWRKTAREIATRHSRRIFAALRTEMSSPVGWRVTELIDENKRLILGLPETIEQQTRRFAGRLQRKGLRSNKIAAEIQSRLPQLRKSSARMLARTAVAGAETALTRARSERLGIAWYEWATSEDSRVRPAHREMDKVLVAWADPPAPEQLDGERSQGHYHPGGTYNCRCLALPLVEVDEVAWPHKVYSHGTIERAGRREFEQYAGVQAA